MIRIPQTLFLALVLMYSGCSGSSSAGSQGTPGQEQTFGGPDDLINFPNIAPGGGVPSTTPDAGNTSSSDGGEDGNNGLSSDGSDGETEEGGEGGENGSTEPEDCTNGIDDDSDGVADCGDPDCAPENICKPENCFNGIDDDEDGLADCLDSECEGVGTCAPEDCTNWEDDDGDGFVDCDDDECVFGPFCQEGDCSDGIDGDGDGFADCQDSECDKAPACTETECGDGLDNDGDSLTDCSDPDCQDQAVCSELSCTDGVDNDLDGLSDCADPDCDGEPNCTGETCLDFYDCLIADGCGCQTGVDCPDSSTAEASACQAACIEDGACSEACIASLNPQTQDTLNNWLFCQESNCTDESTSNTTACVNANCLFEYAQCFAGGTEECAHYGFDCTANCADPACDEACFADLSPSGFLDASEWDSCRYTLCDANGDGAPDGGNCIYFASLYACMGNVPACLPLSMPANGNACSALVTCALNCAPTNEACHLSCLGAAAASELNPAAQVMHCAIATCGTTDNQVTAICLKEAMNGPCSGLAQACGL